MNFIYRNTLIALIALPLFHSESRGQFILPRPSPVSGSDGFPYPNRYLPASAHPQGGMTPISSRPFGSSIYLHRSGFIGSGVYPYFFSGYENGINPNINLNITVVAPEPNAPPRYSPNPFYDALPPEPFSTTSARLTLKVPENSEVWMNGEKSDLKGAMRTYESPTLTNGKSQTYELRIRWLENDKPVEEEKKITLGAGESRTLIFLAAPSR